MLNAIHVQAIREGLPGLHSGLEWAWLLYVLPVLEQVGFIAEPGLIILISCLENIQKFICHHVKVHLITAKIHVGRAILILKEQRFTFFGLLRLLWPNTEALIGQRT